MSAAKRGDTIGAIQKVLQKHYQPRKTVERPVLEQLLYACCLEDSKPDLADEAFARLQESFFDWNEVRVTTVRELGELLRGLRDPERAATAIKQVLHSVFEAIYDFNLDGLLKQNLGVAVKQLEQYRGTTPFTVAYVVQHTLGGHAIPVSQAGIEVLKILGVISSKAGAANSAPGLERAVPKNKGAEFASLLQQYCADYAAAPFGTAPRAILLEIDPDAKDRLPKRGTPKKAEPEPVKSSKPDAAAKPAAKPTKDADKPKLADKVSADKAAAAKKDRKAVPEVKSGKKDADKKDAKEPDAKGAAKKELDKKELDKRMAEGKVGDKKDKEVAKKDADKKLGDKKGHDKKPLDKKPVVKKASAADDEKKKSAKKPPKPIAKKAAPTAKKSASKQLARRKPR